VAVQASGTTLYVDPEAPLLAQAASRGTQKRMRSKGRVYYPSTPRTQQQQQREEAQRGQQGQGPQEGLEVEEELDQTESTGEAAVRH